MAGAEIADSIRSEHPRLFWSPETKAAVVDYAETTETAMLQESRNLADRLATKSLGADDYGPEASVVAFLYAVSDDPSHRELAIELLESSVDYYEQCFDDEAAVSWYAHSRIDAIAAFDWLYADLGPALAGLGERMLDCVDRVQPTDERAAFPRENWGDVRSGFYGTPSLAWHAGVAFHETGIDDQRARELLETGYDQHTDLLAHRSSVAGEVWGSASATPNYALNMYPWAEFLFFHTVESATGESIATDWPYVARLPSYVFWNWLPDCREFGPGDSHHARNQLYTDSLHAHLSQIEHFYADSNPEAAGFAKWLAERLPREFCLESAPIPFVPFFVTNRPVDLDPRPPPGDLPYAKHFPGLGQLYFRSGYEPDSTYASLTASGTGKHAHYDAGHFNIFKDGYLALDSGTRPNPSTHLSHYYPRTVAHNCVTIRMPGEELPTGWGTPDGVDVDPPNDGGQRRLDGAEVVAYESTPAYAYAAIDATATYHEAKCEQAIRQFVFCPPDHFVVFDRIRTTDPEFDSRWLLHAASEPSIGDAAFAVDSEPGIGNDYPSGRLYAKMIDPSPVAMEAVGGPGEQFLADGRNWSFPEHFGVPEELPLFGQWRVEASPATASRTTYFLAVLKADLGEREFTHRPTEQLDPADGPETERLHPDGGRGVRFRDGDRTWTVRFDTDGKPGGKLRRQDHDGVVDRKLARSVQAQPGLF